MRQQRRRVTWGAFHETCHHWQFHWLLPSMTLLHSQSKSRMSLYLSVNDKLSVMTSFMKCPPELVHLLLTMLFHYLLQKTYQLDRSFIHTASRVWNSLPDHVVGTPSCTGLNSFKRRVHRFLLPNGIPWLQYFTYHLLIFFKLLLLVCFLFELQWTVD